jgi:1-aminocyclopropane-1-carboxylate deaminase
MQNINFNNITLDKLSLQEFSAKNVEVSVLRLDKIHPDISGNKWFKLRYYLEEAKALKKKNILTFGGAWSNHIIATASACQLNGFSATGIIRGEEPAELSPMLTLSREMGMNLIFISRDDYSKRKIPEQINKEDYYIISEGGYGIKGAYGAATIADFFKKENYSHICCAAGTGTMTAGLIMTSGNQNKIVAISVLKNNFEIEQQVKSLLPEEKIKFDIFHDYHFGGYAKYNPELIQFMNEFYRQSSIPSDFVYTGKLFYGIHDLISKDHFPSGSKLLLIHSGGLPGNASLNKGTLIF